MCNRLRVRRGYVSPQRNVKKSPQINKNEKLTFSFNDFHIESINIKKAFNNNYKDQEHYIRIITTLFGKGLRLVSNETRKDLVENFGKQGVMHFHSIKNEHLEIVKKILNEYKFSQLKIDDIISGGNLYQLEIPFENGAARVVLELIDNLINFLFIDTNHHIYLNKEKVNQQDSLFFEYCPVFNNEICERMNYLQTCFMVDFLDEKKLEETYNYDYHCE